MNINRLTLNGSGKAMAAIHVSMFGEGRAFGLYFGAGTPYVKGSELPLTVEIGSFELDYLEVQVQWMENKAYAWNILLEGTGVHKRLRVPAKSGIYKAPLIAPQIPVGVMIPVG